ncbi:hypothetical protein [Mastigocoleus testarum]|uniref:PsbP C-terminal domain-containing protein n=1 Tax=Mastigocoleus testarum BC008 TaxID=371196 RepID=A0A0V7ZHG9_9CYAN|nr:hypothetical protein [Mastigocoleus testarum]KST64020.1 hypothetical protein BC008_40200 [Mastigocoleus testarum BC008]KST64730.1 hypothetical protein BC008_41175 [Mastigocoleus testarum BC008]
MTKKTFLPLIATTLIFTGFAGLEMHLPQVVLSRTARSKWQVFTGPDGTFQVLMPGKPEKMNQTQKTFMGEINLQIFLAKPPKQQVAYVVAYNDFPHNYGKMANPQELLDNAQQMALKTTQSKLVSQRNIRSYNNHPGKEIEYINSAGRVTRNRMFFAHGRLYQAMVITTRKQEKYLKKSIRGYLNSFQVVFKK